jgi:hypothetical protein
MPFASKPFALLITALSLAGCAASSDDEARDPASSEEDVRLRRVIRTVPSHEEMVEATVHVSAKPFTDGYLSVYARIDPDYVRSQPGLSTFKMDGALVVLAPLDDANGKVRWGYLDQRSEPEAYEGRTHEFHFFVSDSSVDAVYSYRYDLLAKYGFALVYRNRLGDLYLQKYGENFMPKRH